MKLLYCPNCHKMCKIPQETPEYFITDFGEHIYKYNDEFKCSCGKLHPIDGNVTETFDFVADAVFKVKGERH